MRITTGNNTNNIANANNIFIKLTFLPIIMSITQNKVFTSIYVYTAIINAEIV